MELYRNISNIEMFEGFTLILTFISNKMENENRCQSFEEARETKTVVSENSYSIALALPVLM